MKLRFIGPNGSMGLEFGQTYRLAMHPISGTNGIMITRPITCRYDTDKAFWQDWAIPDEELRTIMEARGRELRTIHIPREEEKEHNVVASEQLSIPEEKTND